LEGEMLSPSLLLRLSPALDLHAVDLFAIAQLEPPDELAPLDPKAGREIPLVVGSAARVSPKVFAELRRYVHALPRHGRVGPVLSPGARELYSPGIGAVVVCILKNRNLDWSAAARVLSRVAGVHLSPATIGEIGHGRKDLTVDLLVAFATVLGIRIGDLMAIAAIDATPKISDPVHDSTVATAELIWDLRDLTIEQVREVGERAQSLAGPS